MEKILTLRNTSGQYKAEALLRLGFLEEESGNPGAAIPYYQRVYVMYGRWKKQVANAYLRSGAAFEQIHDVQAAKRTYEELLLLDLPDESFQKIEARQRLALFESAP